MEASYGSPVMACKKVVAALLTLLSSAWFHSVHAAPPPAWQFEMFYNPVVESRTYFARVNAQDSFLELRCSASDPNTQLRLRLPVDSRSQEVAVNFDENRPQKLMWLPSVNGQSLRLSTEHLKEFSRELRAYNVLKVEVPQDGTHPVSYEFSLAGSAKAISNLRRYCRFI